MDAVLFFKEKERMLLDVELREAYLIWLRNKTAEEIVALVEQWAKEHPIKTYKDVLLEKFPKALLDSNEYPMSCLWHTGMISICPNQTFYTGVEHLRCKDCWNREYKELS